VTTFGTKAMISSAGMKASAKMRTTAPEPRCADKAPATGIMDSEPMPKTRIISPMPALSSPRRAANSGIFGAQPPKI